MKFRKSRTIVEEVELTFARNMVVPKWMFEYDSCELCNIEFDSDEFLDDDIIRARDDQVDDYHSFCKHCFEEVQSPEIELPIDVAITTDFTPSLSESERNFIDSRIKAANEFLRKHGKQNVPCEEKVSKLEQLGLSGAIIKLEPHIPNERHCPECGCTEVQFLVGNLAGGYRCAECSTYYWWAHGMAYLEDPLGSLGYEKRNPDRFTIIENEPEPEQKPRYFWLFGQQDDGKDEKNSF